MVLVTTLPPHLLLRWRVQWALHNLRDLLEGVSCGFGHQPFKSAWQVLLLLLHPGRSICCRGTDLHQQEGLTQQNALYQVQMLAQRNSPVQHSSVSEGKERGVLGASMVYAHAWSNA